MRPLVIRVVRSPVKWAFPLLAIWLFWIASELRRSGFPLWSEVAPSFLYSVLLFGPIAAAFAGLRAWAERRPSLAELTVTAVRDPAARHAVALAGDVLWISAAQVLVVSVTLVSVAAGATWGGPDWGMLLAAFLALWASAAVGWAAGWLIPTRATGPLAGLALYFVMGVALSIDLDFFRSILPLLPSGAPEGLRPSETMGDWVGWGQAVWFGCVTLVGLGVAAAGRRRSWIGVLAVSAVAVATAVILLQAPGRHIDPSAPLVCDRAAIEVCAHPAYQAHLPDMARRSSRRNRIPIRDSDSASVGCCCGRLCKDPTGGRARGRSARPCSTTSLGMARHRPPAHRNVSPDPETHRMSSGDVASYLA